MIVKRMLFSLLGVAFMLVPAVAFGGQSAPATATAPLATGVTEVQFWMAAKPSEAVAIVSVVVPDSVKLPARVRVPLVEGMVVDWAGEISGGDASQDPQRQYVTKQGSGGGSYAEFVIEQYRTAQVDLSGKPLTQAGDEVSAEFEFIQSTSSDATAFSVRLPSIASDVRIDPDPEGEPTTNETGERLFTLPTLELKPGQKSAVSVAYSTTLPGVPGSDGDAAINTLIGVLAALIVVALIAVFVLSQRSRNRAGSRED